MYHPLPRKVRRAIANISRMVSHQTVWGQHTQTVFPGECAWFVEGGHDWPWEMKNVRVGVIATRDGDLVVYGLEAVQQAVADHEQRLSKPRRTDDFSKVANEHDALRQVQHVLHLTKKERKTPAHAREV